MRIWKKLFLGSGLLFAVLAIGYYYYFNSGPTEPTNEIWTAHIGRDTTVGILPDTYANYFTYTFLRPSNNVGIQIKGDFPDTRYLSFNVYDLKNKTTQGSLIDHQIETDSGLPNPFEPNPDSLETGHSFTVNIIPDSYRSEGQKNTLLFKEDITSLLIVIRLYDYDVDDFGGVSYPTVQAITLEQGENNTVNYTPRPLPKPLDLRKIVRKRSLPKMVERLGKLYKTEKNAPLDASSDNKHRTIPFHAIDKRGYIENNDNQYLMAAISYQEDEVYIFKIKSPSYTTGPSDIHNSDVRYWSFNLGNAATYNFNGVKDEDLIIDDEGYAHIILARHDDDIIQRSQELQYNYMEWNMPYQKGLILFRHMLANEQFDEQITDVPPFDDYTGDYSDIEAYQYMNEYAPRGVRMSKSDFLKYYPEPIVGKSR